MRFCQHCGQRLRLGDRYQAFSALGSGQSSRTFMAVDTQKLFDPRCIVKGFAYDGDEVERVERSMESFRQEVAQLEQLSQHPQLPDLYAYFERDRQQFLVQEWIAGRTLLQQLQEEGCFDESQVQQVLLEVLPILHFLHTHQIVHRDIKPANLIRRTEDAKLMLVDYGAAKVITPSGLLKTGTVIGSAEYAAPEQLVGKALFASDLYSLGVTCIHLLTGVSPFDLFHAPSGTWLWRSVAAPVSDRLTQILDKLLQSSLRDRYSSAAAVLADLGINNIPWFEPKKSLLASTGASVDQFKTWDCVDTWQVDAEVNAIALSVDGNRLASGDNDGNIQLWDVEQGKLIAILPADGQAIAALAFSPDGQWLVSGDRAHRVIIWHTRTYKRLQTWVGHQAGVTAIAVAPDGQWVISGSSDKAVNVWNGATDKLIHRFAGHGAGIEAIALSADGHLLASGDADGAIKIWQVETQELLRTLSKHAGAVGAIAFSPDAEILISGSWDMTVQVRHVSASGLIHKLSGHLLPITSVAVHPEGGAIATGSHDATIKLWDLQRGSLLATLTGHTGAVESVIFGPDGTFLLSASRDGTLKRWQHAPPS